MIQSYPWYIADWRNSETRLSLSLAARGLYRELLDYCYMEGSLPPNRELLETIAGANGKQTRFNLEAVLKLFVLKDGPNGPRYYHSKVDEVREKLFSYHKQRKHAGVKSGQSRRERAFNERSAENGTDAEPTPTPEPSPNPAPDSNPQTPAPNGAGSHDLAPSVKSVLPIVRPPRKGKRTTEQVRSALGPERCLWFDSLWEVGVWKDGKLPGMDTYERGVHTVDLAREIHRGAVKYAAKCVSDPTIKVKFLQGWLTDERWTDENAIAVPKLSVEERAKLEHRQMMERNGTK